MAEFDAKYTKTTRQVKPCPPCPTAPPCGCSSSPSWPGVSDGAIFAFIVLVGVALFGAIGAVVGGWPGFIAGAVLGFIITCVVAGIISAPRGP